MQHTHDTPVSHTDPDDIGHNDSPNPTFESVLSVRLNRRALLKGSAGSIATAALGSFSLAACGGGRHDPIESLRFTPVAKSRADAVSVPDGYVASVIYALGDPLSISTPEYRNDGTDTDFEHRAGDHHDGMQYFGLARDANRRDDDSSVRGLLAINHEATSHAGNERASAFVHANGGTNTLPRPSAEVDKEVALHGVSVVEVRKTAGVFGTVRGSPYNRRITPLTTVQLAGVARGHASMRSAYSTTGSAARGTLNNCGTGKTPWGTLLTGEENWAGYFTRGAADNAARNNDKSVASLNRYGRAQGAASRHGWESGGSTDAYKRWDISKTGASADGSDDFRNELNTFGYMVEIDPYDPKAPVKKRTSLGRFAHESAAFSLLTPGKPLAVYMGDDSRGEYVYKWVSDAKWSHGDAQRSDRLGSGDKFLDAGRLYVARFDADGTGEWIELSIAHPAIAGYSGFAFTDNAEVAIHARLAADAVGATKMDRPEWCATHPETGEVYYTLTNNSNRKVEPSGASQQRVDAANPRAYSDAFNGGAPGAPGNVNGHIIRLREHDDEASATRFTWDVYLFGAEAGSDPQRVNLSSLTSDQDFSSPDGLWFSLSTGLAWIQTDDGAYTDVSNCMMLAAVPGRVGDGGKRTLQHPLAAGGTLALDTHVGKPPKPDALKRFLVGPVDCEITGVCETPDGKALFVNIQHPGETISAANVVDPSKYLSHWPANAGYGAGGASTARPRSATIVITKRDGGRVGS
jgi:secreted PhoX family phosphatase